MSPGTVVEIKADWRLVYRKPGASITGILQALSPTGLVARVRMDEHGDSYVLVAHLDSKSGISTLAADTARDAAGSAFVRRRLAATSRSRCRERLRQRAPAA